MVVGTLSFVQNVKPVDAVHSEIVVYGGGDIVFGAKMSKQRMQWMQWMQYAVEYWYVVVGTLSLVQKVHGLFESICRSGANPEKVFHFR